MLGRVRETELAAQAHQDVPFEKLVEELASERSLAHAPLVQVMFALQNTPDGSVELRNLRMRAMNPETTAAKFDLTLNLTEHEGGLGGTMEYATDLFDATTVDRLIGHFERLLTGLVEQVDRRVAEVSLLTAAETRQLAGWNATARDYPQAAIHELFAGQAERSPEAVAVSFGGRELTYGEIDRRALRLAHRLRRAGVGPGSPVGLSAESLPERVVGMLGILAAGGAYVPLDLAYPRERLAFMLEDTGAAVLVAEESLAGRLPIHAGLRVERLDPEEDSAPVEPLANLSSPGDPAYVIYTSGSTGRPKGVVVPHSAVVRLVRGTDYIQLGPNDRVAQASNSSFDAATFEIWGALLNGARLVGLERETLLSPGRLTEALRREGVSVLFLTTALFNQIAREVPAGLAPLRCLLFGGEAVDPAAVRAVLREGPPAHLLHVYGPTETTTFATWQRVEAVPPGETVPIGRPLANGTLYVLAAELLQQPVGVPGELYLGGDGVAHGYHDRPELTAERFVPDPFDSIPGGRLYRTGDLVRQQPDGAVEFLGRLDGQVKIRGFRIETGEIEAALLALPGVLEAAVMVREEAPGERRLVAYVAGEVTADALRAALRERLPDYMVPAAFVILETLPLNPNGKVDRKALPAPERQSAPEASRAPRTPVEEVVAGLWAELLGVERVGLDDDFFALGGHSLLAARVASRLRQVFDVELPVRDLFEAPTVAELAARVEAARRTGTGPAVPALRPPLVPIPREGALPLSFAQQRLWLIDQLQPGTPLYNLPVVLRVEGPLDAAVLARSLGEIVRRHEALRTVFAVEGDSPVQGIEPPAPFVLRRVDLSGLPEPGREARARALTREEAGRPFDLSRDPMLRGLLVRLAPEDHAVALTLHHVASDGWSLGILVREVAALYAAFAQGKPSPLPELPVQYADFAVWQRSWLHGEALEQEIDWWRQELADLPPLLTLPTDRPRPAAQSYRGATRPVRLPAELSRHLGALGRRSGSTLFMVLLAGFEALLGRFSGQDDLAVGSPIAGRNPVETEGLIGFFVNTLVLRGDLSGTPTFGELLGRVREAALAAYLHQDVPFEKLVEELAPERSLAHAPLFQVMLVLQNAPVESLAIEPLRLRPAGDTGTMAKFDLTLTLEETEDGLRGVLEHATDLFDAATIDRLAVHFERLLAAALATPERPARELPLLSPAERHQAIAEWNDTEAVPALQARVDELYAAQVRRTPQAVALVCGDEALTYAGLDARSGRLAAHLLALGAGPDVIVALFLERSIDLVVALLAVLKAGGAYLPLDLSLPRPRLSFLLDDARPSLVLTRTQLLPDLPENASGVVCLDDLPEGAAPEAPAVQPAADNLAYVLYTSGSTGTPKGVAVTHRGLANYLLWAADAYPVGEGSGAPVHSPVSFDLTVTSLFLPLLAGRRVDLVPEEEGVEGLAAALAQGGFGLVKLTPAHLEVLERLLPPERVAQSANALVIGGEALSAEQLAFWRLHAPGLRLINEYGPTETVVGCSIYEVPASIPAGPVPIGRPIANTRILILDPQMSPVPIGVAGELYLGGAGVCRGYLHRPGLTAGKLVPDPFGAWGERLYRTGDLARRLPDGTIEFLGRADHQVKIRGFRIELGEVEAVLAALPGVREAVVVASGQRLVAYVAGDAAVEDLRRPLSERLPDYMVPAVFVILAELPLTANGKVDRKALPAPERQSAPEAHRAPRTPVEEVLAGIWAEVLGLEQVGADGHFFDLGGHSLLATRVMSRLRAAFGVEMPLRDLFAAPRLADLAARVEAALRDGSQPVIPPLIPVPREGTLPLSFAQQRLWFIDQLEPGSPLYNLAVVLRAEGPLEPAVLARCLGEIVRRHEALRTVFVLQGGSPVQVIQPPAPFVLPVVDLSGLPEPRREAEALALTREEVNRPFDLGRDPMLRGVLVRLAAEDHALALTQHHVASDGWSMGLLVREVTALYTAFAAGRPSPLAPLTVQYADFAVWQRSWLSGEALESEIAFWRGELAGLPPLLELPTDRPRPAVQSFRGASRPLRLPAGLTRQAEALARREGATLFMVLLAGFQALLSRYSGQPDLAVGSPVAGRNRIETEELIGFFVNTLVLRGDLSGEPAFRDLLGRARETTLAAYAHQDVPFEKLVQELAPERSLAHTPLFQVLFALQNLPDRAIELPGLSLSPVEIQATTAKFDLELTFAEDRDGLAARLDFATDLFDPSTVVRMAGHLLALLEAVTADPGRRLGELPLLSEAERHQLEAEWNDAPVPAAPGVVELFAAQARRTPDALAVVRAGDEEAGLTYRDLDARSDRLAGRLRALGVGPEVPVGLCVEHGPDLAVAVLGIFRSGGAYVPLDPAHPPARLAFLLEDSAVPVLVTQPHLVEALPPHGITTVLLDGVSDEEEAGEILLGTPAPGDLAYRIYTSGTTGRPKAVEVEHGMLAATLAATRERFGLNPGDRMPVLALSTFDIFLFELLSPLLAGGTAVLFPLRPAPDVERLADHLGEMTCLHAVPALMRSLVDALRRRGPEAPDVTRMRQVFTGGDAVPADLLEDLRQTFPAASVRVLYGPTEATILCSAHEVPPFPEPARPLLGRPLPGAVLHVRDAEGDLLPIGVPGELWIGGPGVARGYLGREELTAEKFVLRGGERFYRSGDRARRLADGTLEFLGRLDHQVKVRGFRIELGEIEAALGEIPGAREALVIVREDQPGDRKLVAYVVGDVETSELRRALTERLPDYMVPAAFVTLPALPLTAHGKVDRKALPAPEWQGAASGYVAPRTREEEILATVWAEILRLPRVGVDDNFFELGGDSILSVQIVARARQAGLLFTTRQVFENQTVAGLARHARSAETAVLAEQGPVVGEVPLTPVQRWFFAQGFADPHHFNQALVLESREPLAPAALERAVAALVEHHDALRMRFDGTRQENAPAEPVTPFHQVDLSGLPAPRGAEAFDLAAAALQAGFDLAAGPLTRLCLFDNGAEPSRLLWVTHHLVVDGVSWRVLLEDLEAAYRGATLPPKTTSFQQWARRLAGHAEALTGELSSWRETAQVFVPRLPVDFPSGGDLLGDEATVSFELSAEETAALLQTLPAVYGSRIEEALLSALLRALADWTGSPRHRVDLEGHGREPLFDDLDVSRTVGWFTSFYPVVLEAGGAGPGEALRSVGERLRAVPGRGIGYGLLQAAGLLEAAPPAEIGFNYLGQVDAALDERSRFRPSGASAGSSRSPRAHRTHRLDVNGLVAGGRLRISLTYGSRTHRRETAERLAAAYAGALRELIRHAREGQGIFPALPLDEGGIPWSPLVPIQPLGTRTPLFCVHALGGEVLTYYRLARELGTGQPVYGLQARPLEEHAEAPQAMIEEMAAGYLEAVRSLQPAGPYLLAGYSFGGVVAFEMARQLTLAGEEVALLALLDTTVPPGNEAAEIDTAAVVADMVRHFAREQGRTVEIDADALRDLPLDDQLAQGLEILGSEEPLGPGFDIPLLRGLALGWSARTTAAERYRASSYPGRITLLRASLVDPAVLRELPPERRQIFEDPTLGWGTVAGSVEVHAVPGGHLTILDAPHVETLAGILGACITRAEGKAEPTDSPVESDDVLVPG
ncbi:MAG TPA: amino acid adenylation domain-containing protein [Thermoanaerobaculia bacterium]|nr:amino acid adenylation domain-containing protein [Thermoanaerobaculia bacterium]